MLQPSCTAYRESDGMPCTTVHKEAAVPIPLAITKYNKKVPRQVTGLVVGLGSFVEVGHAGGSRGALRTR